MAYPERLAGLPAARPPLRVRAMHCPQRNLMCYQIYRTLAFRALLALRDTLFTKDNHLTGK